MLSFIPWYIRFYGKVLRKDKQKNCPSIAIVWVCIGQKVAKLNIHSYKNSKYIKIRKENSKYLLAET